jgi:hypothetical protein
MFAAKRPSLATSKPPCENGLKVEAELAILLRTMEDRMAGANASKRKSALRSAQGDSGPTPQTGGRHGPDAQTRTR